MKSKSIYRTIALILGISLLAAYAVGYPQTGTRTTQTQAAAPQAANTPGRIAKFTTNKAVGDSNITEDDNGNIGIGTTLPTSQLTVNGLLEMLAGGGLKFPDGTVQTTAGIATVSRDGSLKGEGTLASPLGIRVPL